MPVSGVSILLSIGNANRTLTLANGADADTYKINLFGQKTGTIRKDAAAATIEDAIEALTGVGENNVAVTGSVYGPFAIAFSGVLAGQDVGPLTISDITTSTGLTVTPTDPGPTYTSLGGQRKTDFNRSTTEADATSKDSGGYHEGAPMIRDSLVSCDEFVLESDAVYLALEQAWLNGAKLLAQLGMPSGHVYQADATLTKFPITGPHENLATIAIEVKLSGLLTKV